MLLQIKSKIFFTLFIFLSCFILIFSLFISIPSVKEVDNFDKIEHTAAYMVLAFLFFLSFQKNKKIIIISALLCTLYGGIIEILQAFTGRNPEVIDFAADFAGAVIGSVAGWIVVNTN